MPQPDYTRKNVSAYVPNLQDITELQLRFVEEYLIDLNPKQAAIRAGYPPNKAQYAATQVMKHPPVCDLIAKRMAERSKRVGLSADRVLQRLGALALGDPRALFTSTGGLVPPTQLDADDALLIAGVKTRRIVAMNENGEMQPEEIVEVKIVDQLAATTLAMRHLGMLNEKIDVNVTHALADRLQHAYRRVADRSRGTGPVIDGEFVEDVANSLQALEDEARVLQNQVAHEETRPPPVALDDVW